MNTKRAALVLGPTYILVGVPVFAQSSDCPDGFELYCWETPSGGTICTCIAIDDESDEEDKDEDGGSKDDDVPVPVNVPCLPEFPDCDEDPILTLANDLFGGDLFWMYQCINTLDNKEFLLQVTMISSGPNQWTYDDVLVWQDGVQSSEAACLLNELSNRTINTSLTLNAINNFTGYRPQ